MDPQPELEAQALQSDAEMTSPTSHNTIRADIESTSKATDDVDTCRICRSEGNNDEPLFYPCKCSGSIKYVHQECLMEWLSHSQKKHCELCKTPFRFTKLYSPSMPEKLPTPVFIRRAMLHTLRQLLTWCRASLVASVWLFWLPWSMRFVFWGLFWIADGGWAQDHGALRLGLEGQELGHNTTSMDTVTVVAGSHEPTATTLFSFARLQSRFKVLSNLMSLADAALGINRTTSANNTQPTTSLNFQDDDSLLSGLAFFRNLTPDPRVNKFITDILEGQIITLAVVVAFILVFLIREWVVQQQPALPGADVIAANLAPPALPPAAAPEQPEDAAEDQSGQHLPTQDGIAGIRDEQEASSSPAGSADTLQANLRPNMPTRSQSSLATEIRRELEESTSAQSEERHNNIQGMSSANTGLSSTNSSESWHQVSGSDHDVEFRSFGQSTPIAAHRDESLLPTTDVSWPSPETDLAMNEDRATHIDDIGHEPMALDRDESDNMQSIFAPTDEERASAGIAVIQPTAADSDHNDSEEGESTQRHGAQQGLLSGIWDWIFADIHDPRSSDVREAADDDDHDIGDHGREGPLIPIVDGEPELRPRDADDAVPDALVPDNEENALNAENDRLDEVEAIEDAEDLEGVLELIGMQGPIAGLFQNAVFCAVLISLTVTTAVWFPYLWGKIVLVFLAHPLELAIEGPFILTTWICNFVLDVGLYFGCSLLTLLDTAVRLLLMPLGAMFPSLAVLGKQNLIGAAMGDVSNSALERLHDLLLASAELPASDFYHLSLSSHASLKALKQMSRTLATQIGTVLQWSWQNLSHLEDVQGTFRSASMLVSQSSIRPEDLPQRIAKALLHTRDSISIPLATYSDGNADPALAHWSATDRLTAVVIGYLFFALVGVLYLRSRPPLTNSAQIRRIEEVISEILRQAGGVLKVILIISIEMLLFPLYCGFLLDIAVLPLFGASFASRSQFTLNSPWSSCFIHWFLGTCYMFHFALFVSMCRKLLRHGVLYFIRDPDDPTFHPVRDVLERNIATQLRKIGFSALVYGALVILCMGSVVWTTSYCFSGLFPVRTSSLRFLEFPVDLMLYHTVTPLVVHLLKPASVLESFYNWWFLKCGHALRLSQFLFSAKVLEDNELPTAGPEDIAGGKWVRAPACDQVRIPRGHPVFLEVDQDNNRIDGLPDDENDKGPHGKANAHFRHVYIPPWFRLRVVLFVFCVWLLTAVAGLSLTVAPLLFGRFVLAQFVDTRQQTNDIHAFSIGISTLAGICYTIQSRHELAQTWRQTRASSTETVNNALIMAKQALKRVSSLLYTYGFLTLVMPTFIALLLEFYLIMPIFAYVQFIHQEQNTLTVNHPPSNTTSVADPASSAVEILIGSTDSNNTSILATSPTSKATSLIPADPYTIHVLQSWTLGLLYTRILVRFLLTSYPTSKPTRALHSIVSDGWLNPNVRIATRCFVLPLTVLATIALTVPAMLAAAVTTFVDTGIVGLSAENVSRFAYPVVFAIGVVALSLVALGAAVDRWRRRIRDEVYLVGERLHNYGESAESRAKNRREKEKGKGKAVVVPDETSRGEVDGSVHDHAAQGVVT